MSSTLPRTISGSNASGSHFLGKDQQCEYALDTTSTLFIPPAAWQILKDHLLAWAQQDFLSFKYMLVFLYKYTSTLLNQNIYSINEAKKIK